MKLPRKINYDALYGHKHPLNDPNLGAMFVKRLNPEAVLPAQATDGSVGFDLCATHYEVIGPDCIKLYTGLAVTPPTGYYFDLVLRSSMYKFELSPATGLGVIDQDYTGELSMVCKSALDDLPFYVERERGEGERVQKLNKPFRFGQLVPRKVHHMGVVEVEELTKTERGSGGFGSTNKEDK